MTDVLVIGSINADQVVVTDSVPKKGETVIGKTFTVVPGGKGANQAVAASRLGSKTDFIGCVGNDSNGDFLLDNFKKNNISTDGVKRVDTNTGVACITVNDNDNSIIVVPGANFFVNIHMIEENIQRIKSAKIVLLQLEIPKDTVEFIIDICYENNIKVLLNPAPFLELKRSTIDKVTYLTPNETEAKLLFGTDNYEELVKRYPNKLIITLGDKGAIFNDGIKNVIVPAREVEVVDTTGAGDTFNGAFASRIISGFSVLESIIYANKAASIKITKLGAQDGMPTKEVMEEI